MKTILTFVFLAALGLFGLGSSEAQACDSACKAAQAAAARAPYHGPLAPTTVPMACVRVVSYGHTEVVWVNGNKDNFREGERAFAWQGRNSGYTETFSLNSGWTVTESCIQRSKLNKVSDLVLCNDVPGEDGYHWALTAKELASLKRNGHFTSYVPFLEVLDRESLSPATVTKVYMIRYGI